MAKKTTIKKTPAKKTARKAAKRELIDTGSDKRFVRRGAAGRFKEPDDVGKSLTADRRKKAKSKAKSGQVIEATGCRFSKRRDPFELRFSEPFPLGRKVSQNLSPLV